MAWWRVEWARSTATQRVQVRGHDEVARNGEAQGDVGACQRRHVLSLLCIIAVVASLLLVVGPWWALEGEHQEKPPMLARDKPR